MTGIIFAAILSIQNADASETHRHVVHKRNHHAHHRSKRLPPPPPRAHHRWVWVPGKWEIRSGRSIWIWGYWDLRPTQRNRHVCNHRR